MNNETIPAFPIKEAPYSETFDGMSLRDYFASKAMQTMLQGSANHASVAKYAYKMADEMMKAREQ